jgi:DNA-binding NtrC family response regulator/GGDEF domain-containing protein
MRKRRSGQNGGDLVAVGRALADGSGWAGGFRQDPTPGVGLSKCLSHHDLWLSSRRARRALNAGREPARRGEYHSAVDLASRVRIAAVALAGSALLCRSATAEEPKRIVCPPVTQDIVINGELDEWDRSTYLDLGEANLVRKDPSYGGPADLSGRIYIARSATTLYIAGEIHDDTLYWNPKESYLGDGVEIFLDFHPHPEARAEANGKLEPGYDSYVSQLLLHPLASEVRWRFAKLRGVKWRPDDPVDGLQLAGLPLRDAKGATIGYKFELALPFSNFPDAPTAEGASFGFDVALSDSDGLPQQKNYATWTGHSDLATYPGRFGRLILGKAPPPVPAPEGQSVFTIGPVAVLVAVVGALLFLWLAQVVTTRGAWLARRLEVLRRIDPRRKLAAAAVLTVLIAAAGFLADGATRALEAADLAQKRKVAALVRSVADEAGPLHLIDPQPPAHESSLVSLLAGKTVKPPDEYEYTVIPPVAEEPCRTLSGVPFLRRDIPATTAWSGNFVVEPAVVASAATAVYSWRPEAGAERTPKNGEKIAEIRLVREDGTVDARTLTWGRQVDAATDPSATGTAHPGAPDARVAFVTPAVPDGARPAEHADEITWTPAASPSPVRRVELEQVAVGGSFVLHGVTLTPASGGAPVPLPLGRATLRGVPTCASPSPGPSQGLQLSKETRDRVPVDCGDVAADKLWIVASLRRGFPDTRYRAPVLRVDAIFDDGSVEGPFPLENGVSIDAESTPARQHGDAYTSEIAFEWGLPGQPNSGHFDCVPIEFEQPSHERRLREVQFESMCVDEVVRISSITAGKRVAARRPQNLASLESKEDGYHVVKQDLDRFEGLTFTMFRDGAAIATTAAGDLRDRMLARTLSSEQAAAAARDPDEFHEHEVTATEDRRLRALSVVLPGGRVLEMAWSSGVAETVAAQVSVVRMCLAVLLAPLLVLVVADYVLTIGSLHVRLVAAAAAVAAVPVALGWFAVPFLLGSAIEGRETEAATLKSAAVKGRLSAMRSLARQRAESALRDETLQEALRRRGSPEYRGAVAAALRDVERALGGDARVALEVFPLSSAGEPIVFPQQVQWTVFADRTATLTDELAYRLSRLTATGAATQYDTAGDWRTTLVVEMPLQRAALADAVAAAGGGVQAMLYTARGYPMAATLETQGDDLPEELRHKQQIIQRVLAAQQPVVETRMIAGTPHTVAFDVLRGEAGAVGLVGTAVPRDRTEALLRRIGLVAILVFGAGVVMQFLLSGLVVASTSKPFQRTLREARDAAGQPGGGADELESLQDALAAVRADREAYRDELSRLAGAVPQLAAADGPDAVVERAVAVVREIVAPWGALLVAADADGRFEVLGGFRGADAVPRGTVVVAEAHPLAAVVAGDAETHLASRDGLPEISVRGDRPLVGGASRLDAWPIGSPGRPGGALVLLAGPDAPERPLRVHDRFVAAFARNVGMALASARLVRLAVHDADTNAYVPAFFTERLEEEVDRAVTGRQHIALLLVRATALPPDPAAARRSMQQLADAVRAAAPVRTFLGRVETDTIGAAAPETDRPAADALAAALRRILAERGLAGLRVRIGLAACPEDAGSCEFLNAEARRGLASEDPAHPQEAPRASDDRVRLVAEARAQGAVFESDTGLKILETIDRIASSDLSILIEGETGSGKEVVAELIHQKSGRRGSALVKVNCAALPDALLESELFGYERGAFTGADRTKPGRFELADGGTIFLDEIGDMPLATQVKLLRVLEDRAVEHLGGTAPTPIDVRVIAATNRDLRAAMNEGRFREDLYYRLSGVTIAVPPLRARKEDIPRLAERFARGAAESRGRPAPTFGPDAMDLLYRHAWPGNVRELRNVVEQAVVMSSSDVVRAADLAPALAAAGAARPRSPIEPPRREPSRGLESPRPAPGGISDRQRRLLALLSEREWVTNADYCELAGVSQRTGLRDIQELLERGVIVMEGKRRGARYRLR